MISDISGVEVTLGATNPDKNDQKLFFAEVESVSADTKKQALQDVKDFFSKVGLKSYSKSEYQSFLRLTDRTCNFHFPLSEFPEALLKNPQWSKIAKETVLS